MKEKLLLLSLLMSISALTTSAQDVAVENADGITIYYNFINNKTELEVAIGPYEGNINIPETVYYDGNTYSVTSIGMAFYGCSGLTSVTIPNSVTSIGYCAFYDCSGLTSITIPNSVTTIGDRAFYRCSGLTSITIPNSVTSIGYYAFMQCTSLTSVTIPNSVTTIGNYAFYRCSGLTSITIPNSVTTIGDNVFEYCNRLTSVISLIEEPFEIDKHVFYVHNHDNDDEYEFTSATLYVPTGTKSKYESTPAWNEFKNIVEGIENAVKSVETDVKVEETERYNVSGQRINSPQKGLNIIRYSDGTTRKVMCK